MRVESVMTASPSTSTGTRSWPLSCAHRRAVGRVDLDGLDLEALVGQRERDALDVGGVGEAV